MYQRILRLVKCALLGVALVFSCQYTAHGQKNATAKVTPSSLLDELISFEENALFPAIPFRSYQVSSYDRASKSPNEPNWFANNDGFGIIREESYNGKKVRVLFDEIGPGAITRIWVTAINKRGVLRFFIDGKVEPTLSVNAYDFAKFGIAAGENGLVFKHTSYREGDDKRGGSTFFYPITYAKSCKVTYEAPTDIPLRQKYYHFNVRKFDANVNVQSFSPNDLDALKSKIAKVGEILNNPVLPTDLKALNKSATLKKGQSLIVELPNGENAIYELKINLKTEDKASYAQAMRSAVLKANFDGIQTVLAPLGDFAGGGFGAKEVKSWYLSNDGSGLVTSRWIMPYRKSGLIIIENLSDKQVDVDVQVSYKSRTWTDRSLYFYSYWRTGQGVRLSNDKTKDEALKPIDWNFATLTGRGVYKGDVMSLFNHSRAWYGEGDEKIYIDGESFPSHFGTGLEDYYNSSWAPVVVFHTPFGGAPRADLPSSHGYNTFFRTRNLDGIAFNKSLKFDMETLSWTMGKADFATTIYFYADANTKALGTATEKEASIAILPDAKEHIVENAVEFEKIQPTYKSGNINVSRQAMNRYDSGLWSDGKHLIVKNAQLNDELKFEFKGYPNEKHLLKLHLTKSLDFGVLAFWVNGQKVEKEFDAFANAPTNAEVVLGEFEPVNGLYELKVKVVGTNPKSQGGKYLIGLDALAFIKTVKSTGGEVVNSVNENTKIIEFENVEPVAHTETMQFKKHLMNRYKGVWSQDAHLVFFNPQLNDVAEFKFDGFEKGKYNVKLLFTKAPDFGIIEITLNGKKLSPAIDGFNDVVVNAEIDLGEIVSKVTHLALKVKVVGANGKSKRGKYLFGLDALVIDKK